MRTPHIHYINYSGHGHAKLKDKINFTDFLFVDFFIELN